MAIGQRLKEERTRLGLSQAELAAAAGIVKKSQTNYELGHSQPSASYLAAIAGIGIDVLYVLTGHAGSALAADEAALLQRYRMASPEIRTAALAVLGASPAIASTAAPEAKAEAPVATFGGDNRGNVARTQKLKKAKFTFGDR